MTLSDILKNLWYGAKGQYGCPRKYFGGFFDVDGELCLKSNVPHAPKVAFYKKDGSMVTDYGGQHLSMDRFMDVDGVKCLIAYDLENDHIVCKLIRKGSSIIEDYGGPHLMINHFVEEDGKKYLFAKNEGQISGYFSKDGQFFDERETIRLFTRLESLGLKDQSRRVYDILIRYTLDCFSYEKDGIYHAFTQTFDTLINKNQDDITKRTEVDSALQEMEKALLKHPEKFLESLKVNH